MTITPHRSDRPLYWPEFVYTLQESLADSEVYLVGGVVRDVYMHRPAHDLDLATPQDGRPIARRIANTFGGDYYPLDEARGVGRTLLVWQGTRLLIDVARFRGGSLLADLQDRDFTANALAVNLHDLGSLIDPLNGAADIRDRVVRLCNPRSIATDPVRALRALRLSLAWRMRISPETREAIRRDGVRLRQVSTERVRDELIKLLGGPKPMTAISLLDTLGLLPLIFPEAPAMKNIQQSAPHIFDVWRHTLSVIDSLEDILETIGEKRTDSTAANFALGMIAYTLPQLRVDLQNHLAREWPNQRPHRALLVLAALAHDIAKPLTQSVGTDGHIHFYSHEEKGREIVARWGNNLALSTDEIERLKIIVRHHMRPLHLHQSGLSRRAIYRFWRDLGVAGVDVCVLALADTLGKYGSTLPQADWLKFTQVVRKLLEGFYHQHEQLVEFKPFVNGDDLMHYLQLKPGPLVGQLIAALREAQALGEVQSPADSLKWAAEWLNEQKADQISHSSSEESSDTITRSLPDMNS